jgi:hypothetical protein
MLNRVSNVNRNPNFLSRYILFRGFHRYRYGIT